MKLFLCKNCHSIKSLRVKRDTVCRCGKSRGRYVDNVNAVYNGQYVIPLGIDNESIVSAVREYEKKESGRKDEVRFDAFVIPHDAPSIKFI